MYGVLVYALAGFVKGVVILLALLVPVLGLKEAMAILIVPKLSLQRRPSMTGVDYSTHSTKVFCWHYI